VTFAFSCSEMVMVSSKGFLHFSQRYSYLGIGLSPDSVLVSVSEPCQIRVCTLLDDLVRPGLQRGRDRQAQRLG
jgi:hypothetical protein